MSHNNTKLTWMPVTKETKPNQDGLGASNMSYKEKYSSLKLQLKSILYENELYNSELIKLKRELIDIYSDKDTLLRRIIESGADLGTSDDEDSESQLSDILLPASCGDNLATIAAPASAPAAIDSDATSNVVISMPQIMATATTTTTSQAPIMTTNTNTASTNTTTTTNTTDSRSKPKATSKPRAKPRPPANKASKAVGTTHDISNTANNETNGLASKSNATNTKLTTNACAPVKQPAAKRKKQQAADQQQPTQAQQIDLKINPLTEDQSVKATKPPAPKRQRKPAQKKPPQPKKSPELPQQQLQLQLQQHQQQQQQIQQPQQKHQHLNQPQQQLQQQPMTVIGQVQVSLPNDHMKFVQHVNLPEQNLAGTNNLIVTNQAANSIQLHQNHDNNNQQHHRIHFQLPQTTISTMDSFQTPQSVMTTSQQGGHLNYGQHQSYTIVATNSNGNLIHHDLNQHHTNSPPVQITQLVPINQTMGQHLSNQAIQNQNMNQEINTIGFQQIQHHSNDHHNQQQQQQQQQQQHRQDDTTNYEHQIVHFELPQIQLPQQQQSHIPHSHRIHLQTQQQQVQQQQQRIQQSQNDPIAPDDLEQHLDGRRLDQAPLLMSDWESSVPSELFGSDSAIKFMAED